MSIDTYTMKTALPAKWQALNTSRNLSVVAVYELALFTFADCQQALQDNHESEKRR